VGIPQQLEDNENNQIKHRYVMEWMRQFDSVELALERLLLLINTKQKRIEVEEKLRSALQSYISPSDTLIYRFISSNNQNLLKNLYFIERARDYLNTLPMVIKEFAFFYELKSLFLG
jgi:hypothetical protein